MEFLYHNREATKNWSGRRTRGTPRFTRSVGNKQRKSTLQKVLELKRFPVVPPHQVHHVDHHVASLHVNRREKSYVNGRSDRWVQILLQQSDDASLRLTRSHRDVEGFGSVPLVLLLHVFEQLYYAHSAHRLAQVTALQDYG